MLSAVLSFLGGSAFRMIWGELSSWLSKKQDHTMEMERLRFEAEREADQHARNLESIRVQADLQVKVIQVQAEGKVAEIETSAWLEAVKATGRKVGVKWVDAWNAGIRPGVATWAILMLSLEAFALIAVSEGTASVCYSALGLYLADRTLAKRGK